MEQGVRKIFALKDRDVRQTSSLSLAFLGDSVYELAIRTFLVERELSRPKKLNEEKCRLVNAAAQAEIVSWLEQEGHLTEEEAAVYRRGRNANIPTMNRHAKVRDYRRATGLECLMGYLYLSGREERLLTLIRLGLEHLGEIAEKETV